MMNKAEWVGISLGVLAGVGGSAAVFLPHMGAPAPVSRSVPIPPKTARIVAAPAPLPKTVALRRESDEPVADAAVPPPVDDRVDVAAAVLNPIKPVAAAPMPQPTSGPLVSIVIDDMGGNAALSQQALALPANITFAFLPYPKASPRLAEAARAMGREVILHMPMQPVGGDNPGPGALRPDSSDAENTNRFTAALSRLPGVKAFNNHMGSRMTVSADALLPVMDVAAARRIRFLDSRTAEHSVALRVARSEGVEAIGRDVFLDHVIDPRAIKARLLQTEAIARKRGYAVAIGHPHPATLAVLADYIVDAQKRGVRIGNLDMAFSAAGYGQVAVAETQMPEPVSAEVHLAAAQPLLGGADTGPAPAPPLTSQN